MDKKIAKNWQIALWIILIIICIFSVIKNNSKEIDEEQSDVEEIVDDRLFGKYYKKAEEKLNEMTIDEKIAQILLVRYPDKNGEKLLEEYKFGGYILFEKDFKGKTEENVKDEINTLQEKTSIPLLIAVDEEGGNVVRISSNKSLIEERFKSPRELYLSGGFDRIKEDTIKKSEFLYNLGINLNLAPVVDISTKKTDYIYKRTLGEDASLTSEYAKTVIEASKDGKVSYTLKHFPGYGSNQDTHNGISTDNSSYEEIMENSLKPFKTGIEVGAEAVMVSHNIITSIDKDNLASLSINVHDVLKNELGFTGVIITDALDMGAIASDKNAASKAVIAGNDLIIITDYEDGINDIKNAMNEGKITEDMLNERALQVLAWKYYKGMM